MAWVGLNGMGGVEWHGWLNADKFIGDSIIIFGFPNSRYFQNNAVYMVIIREYFEILCL